MTLTVVDDHLQRLLPRLGRGELDLAMIYRHEALSPDGGYDCAVLLEDEFRVVLPAGHRLVRRSRPLELAQLEAEPWIGGAPDSAWYRIASHHCRAAGFVPRVAFASDDYAAVQALVAAGLGVSVIPGLAVAHPVPGVEVRPLAANAPVRQICAARPRNGYRGPAVTAMLESLTQAARALGG